MAEISEISDALESARVERGPVAVLEEFRRAAITQSAERMRDLYAVDAVHEFPFSLPGVPARIDGRDNIMEFVAAGWAAGPLRYTEYRTIAVHQTDDSDTIIVEQEAVGIGQDDEAVVLPNIVVMTVRAGRISRLRDYVNVLAAARAAGIDVRA